MNVSDIIKHLYKVVDVPGLIICLTGLTLFGIWLVKTSLGRSALADSVPRRNNMAPYLPFIPLLICFAVVPVAALVTTELLGDLSDWQEVFLDTAVLCAGTIVATMVIIFLARATFARRLKGFGLNIKTIPKDFWVAAVNLLSVWPLVMAVLILTMYIGQLIWGQDWQMQRHEELETIIAYPQLPLRVLIVFTAGVVAPVFEEMLFRGMFQTMIRSFLARSWPVRNELQSRGGSASARTSNEAWLSIVISSALFIMVHQNRGHWPALFALSMCMGYAYEKSGSLFRPIFIHSFFNTAMVVAVLYQ